MNIFENEHHDHYHVNEESKIEETKIEINKLSKDLLLIKAFSVFSLEN